MKRKVIHWRDASIRSLFYRCRKQLPRGHLLHKTYFVKTIPKYVKLSKSKDELCSVHINGYNLMKEIKKCRLKWHQNCKCDCIFCSKSGCNHGSSPDKSGDPNADCAFHTCPRCKNHECDVEWNDERTTWYTTSLELREGGGQHWVEHPHKTTRQEFMTYWKLFMEQLAIHNIKNEVIKDTLDDLKNNLPQNHIFVKADFIQNYVHRRSAESAESHYNRRQSQLLVFVVWYHSKRSTIDNPRIRKVNFAYFSGFLRHTSGFFQKCFLHLNKWIREMVNYTIEKVYIEYPYYPL